MSEIKFSNFINEDGNTGTDIVGVTTFTSPYYFVPPSGTTAQRPSGEGLAPGMLRFNTDIGRLEVWRGDHWATILGESPTLDGGARGLFGGGGTTPASDESNIIDYITISTLGNATDFGDLTVARDFTSATSSRTRGMWFGGNNPGVGGFNTIDYVTISSTGNAIDFGSSQSATGRNNGAVSNGTRGICSGFDGNNTIDYLTIASTGSRQDFGDLYFSSNGGSGVNSSTRGIFCGGSAGASPYGTHNVIQFITISTLGDSTDFGDLTSARASYGAGVCNSTRGVLGGGYVGPGYVNTIDFITIATLGNAVNFGTLTQARSTCGSSSPIRGVFGGGYYPTLTNIIDYVTIMSTGNAIDFGDLSVTRRGLAGCSNGHGGL